MIDFILATTLCVQLPDIPQDVFTPPQTLVCRLRTVDELNQQLLVETHDRQRYMVVVDATTAIICFSGDNPEGGVVGLQWLREFSLAQTFVPLTVLYATPPKVVKYGQRITATKIVFNDEGWRGYRHHKTRIYSP